MHARVIAALAATTLGLLSAQSSEAALLNKWVQYGDGIVLIRSIGAQGDSCPAMAVDGSPLSVAQRFTNPTAVSVPATATTGAVQDYSFPIVMCEASVSLNFAGKVATVTDSATGITYSLKMPVATPKRLLIIGDTGCRIVANSGTNTSGDQNCTDPNAFPLQRLSTYASVFKPDAIIHTGDFYYREYACTVSSYCGTTFGENWATWSAEWFAPARTLMETAPIALTRGNHESCGRGARGWFKLLDVHPYSTTYLPSTTTSTFDSPTNAYNCPRAGYVSYRKFGTTPNPTAAQIDPLDVTPSYVVPMGPISSIMFDVSYASDTVQQSNLQAVYAADINNAVAKLNGKHAFFVMHKPAYGLNTSSISNGVGGGGNVNMQVTFNTALPQAVSTIVSGHTHNFQVVDTTNSNFAPQLVIGDSGTLLDGQQVCFTASGCPAGIPVIAANANYSILTADGGTPTAVGTAFLQAVNSYGFAVLDLQPDNNTYLANVYTLNGTKAGRCVITLSPRSLTCGS